MPQQNNSWDCGVFICQYALSILRVFKTLSRTASSARPRNIKQLFAESVEFSFDSNHIAQLRIQLAALISNYSNIYRSVDTINIVSSEATNDKDQRELATILEADHTKTICDEERSRLSTLSYRKIRTLCKEHEPPINARGSREVLVDRLICGIQIKARKND